MKKDYREIPAQFKRFNKDEPYSRPLTVMVELLQGTYELLFHPVYGNWRDYDAIDHFKVPLRVEHKYDRTYFERTIFQAKQWEHFRINGQVQWMTSEGNEHAIEHVHFLWQKLNDLQEKEAAEDNNFESGIEFFRLTTAGFIMAYAREFAYTCNHMILTNRKNQHVLEINSIAEQADKAIRLQRMKSNLEHEKDQLDRIVFDGLMQWIDVELSFHKRVNEMTEVSNEIRLIIEAYLAEKKTRRSNLQLMQQLMDEQLDEFCNGLSALVVDAFSSLDFAENEAERNYHALLGGLLTNFSIEYKLSSNRESGLGRYDLMLTPNHLGHAGLIIEVKKIKAGELEKKEQVLDIALAQIKNKQYFHELKRMGHTKVITIAAACCSKQLFLKYAVLDLQNISQ